MRSLRLRPSTLCLRLFVAAAAFALGLAAWGLCSPRGKPACAPLVVEVRTENGRGKFDSLRYETCRGAPYPEGRYVNDAYGFSVAVPGGAVPAAPAPDASFAGYGPLPRGQFDEAVVRRLGALRARGANVSLRSATPTTLGGLPAVRVVATYEEGGEEMLSDEVVAYRRGGGGAEPVVYALELSTRLADYERDRPVLEEMRRSWHTRTPR